MENEKLTFITWDFNPKPKVGLLMKKNKLDFDPIIKANDSVRSFNHKINEAGRKAVMAFLKKQAEAFYDLKAEKVSKRIDFHFIKNGKPFVGKVLTKKPLEDKFAEPVYGVNFESKEALLTETIMTFGEKNTPTLFYFFVDYKNGFINGGNYDKIMLNKILVGNKTFPYFDGYKRTNVKGLFYILVSQTVELMKIPTDLLNQIRQYASRNSIPKNQLDMFF